MRKESEIKQSLLCLPNKNSDKRIILYHVHFYKVTPSYKEFLDLVMQQYYKVCINKNLKAITKT